MARLKKWQLSQPERGKLQLTIMLNDETLNTFPLGLEIRQEYLISSLLLKHCAAESIRCNKVRVRNINPTDWKGGSTILFHMRYVFEENT